MKASRVILLLALLLTAGAFSAAAFGLFVAAEAEDPLDSEVHVETEDEVVDDGQPEPGTGEKAEDMTAPDVEPALGPAIDVEASYIFVGHNEEELPAGKVIKCLISLRNVGETKKNYLVNTIGASLRYPVDYSYYLQNYTLLLLNRTLDANRESTFVYVFKTSERFAGRPFGFVIEANYFDDEDKAYLHTVFNKTLNFVEIDDVLDAEALMMYLLFGAIIVLVAVIVYYYALGGHLKLSGSKRPKSRSTDKGGNIKNGAALNEWLPAHARKPSKPSTPKAKKSKKEN